MMFDPKFETQKEMAEHLGVHPSMITYLKRDKRWPDVYRQALRQYRYDVWLPESKAIARSLDRLIDLIDSPNEAIALGAINKILVMMGLDKDVYDEEIELRQDEKRARIAALNADTKLKQKQLSENGQKSDEALTELTSAILQAVDDEDEKKET